MAPPQEQVQEVKKSFQNQGFDSSNDAKTCPVIRVDYVLGNVRTLSPDGKNIPMEWIIRPLCPRVLAHITKWTKEQLQVFTDRSDLWNSSSHSDSIHFGRRHNSSGVKGGLSAGIPFRKDW